MYAKFRSNFTNANDVCNGSNLGLRLRLESNLDPPTKWLVLGAPKGTAHADISDSLFAGPTQGELLYKKTGGNPGRIAAILVTLFSFGKERFVHFCPALKTEVQRRDRQLSTRVCLTSPAHGVIPAPQRSRVPAGSLTGCQFRGRMLDAENPGVTSKGDRGNMRNTEQYRSHLYGAPPARGGGFVVRRPFAKAVTDTRTPISFSHWMLRPGATVDQPLPDSHNGFVYVLKGNAEVGSDRRLLINGRLRLFPPGSSVTLTAPKDASAHAELPLQTFVMNTETDLLQAFKDF